MNGLEALERIKNKTSTEVATLGGYVKMPVHHAYKKEFAIIKKELKALEIIKEKYVNPILLKDEEEVVGYNERVSFFPTMKLTKDEFNLLKEVLK